MRCVAQSCLSVWQIARPVMPAARGLVHGDPRDGLAPVAASTLAGVLVLIRARRREHPLPRPRLAGAGQLAVERVGKLDPPPAAAVVGLVLGLPRGEVRSQGRHQRRGQDRGPVLVAFAFANGDLVALEVEVFDPQSTTLHEAKTRSVKQRRHHLRRALHLAEQAGDFVAPEHGRQALRPSGADESVEPRKVDAEDVSVEKQECCERLILRRRGDAVVGGESAQEGRDLVRAQPGGIPAAVRFVEATYPHEIGLFRPGGEVAQSNGGANTGAEGLAVVLHGGLRGQVGPQRSIRPRGRRVARKPASRVIGGRVEAQTGGNRLPVGRRAEAQTGGNRLPVGRRADAQTGGNRLPVGPQAEAQTGGNRLPVGRRVEGPACALRLEHPQRSAQVVHEALAVVG
jgi:hypothetical protein